ncbi:hypothetical protein EVAR_94202_1 [Eumeta japonica]|uniref:Uncharacterized protein n=1 Tax=Eumeta variegata TaxID=151549 RepID=A0A4C1UMY3_EUMVA|nr:hypothetical protein EVAR_94202_1 [Eumeta japonica]
MCERDSLVERESCVGRHVRPAGMRLLNVSRKSRGLPQSAVVFGRLSCGEHQGDPVSSGDIIAVQFKLH